MNSLLMQGYDSHDKSQYEKWKPIPGYDGIYEASTEGRIRTCEGKTTYTKRHGVRLWKQRILKPKAPKADGYRGDLRVSLWKNGKNKDFLVARLVAMTWVDGYAEGMTVNHIDGNHLNNRANNLEWVTLADNIRHGFRNGLFSSHQKCVTLSSVDGVKYHFDSMAEADRFLSRCHGYVWAKVNGSRVATSADGSEFIVKEG